MNNRLLGAGCAVFLATMGLAWAQTSVPAPAMPPPHDPNDYPTFGYHVQEGWAKLPAGRVWGGVSAVDMDKDGKSVWVFERCGKPDDGCVANRNDDPVMKFDQNGNLVRHWGAGQFQYPHGIFVDARDNVWLIEGISLSKVAVNTVKEYSQDGHMIRSMGKAGASALGPDVFNGVSDVLQAPNGDIFVADGHTATTNNRIVKYDRNGKYLMEWGKMGAGPGEFNSPHGLAMDKAGRLYVADRSNNRIQIFDQQGKFLAEWKQFGRPSGLFITKNDMIYVADSLSNQAANPGFKNGIRWGNIKDGKVIGFIPWNEYNAIEGVAVDDAGNIYAGFTNVPGFRKFVKN